MANQLISFYFYPGIMSFAKRFPVKACEYLNLYNKLFQNPV